MTHIYPTINCYAEQFQCCWFLLNVGIMITDQLADTLCPTMGARISFAAQLDIGLDFTIHDAYINETRSV